MMRSHDPAFMLSLIHGEVLPLVIADVGEVNADERLRMRKRKEDRSRPRFGYSLKIAESRAEFLSKKSTK